MYRGIESFTARVNRDKIEAVIELVTKYQLPVSLKADKFNSFINNLNDEIRVEFEYFNTADVSYTYFFNEKDDLKIQFDSDISFGVSNFEDVLKLAVETLRNQTMYNYNLFKYPTINVYVNHEDIKKITSAIVQEGTTSCLATTMTQSPENINNALKAVKEYKELNKPEGALVLGVHLEGPFISTSMIGAQPLEYVANPNVEIFKKYQEVSGNNIRLVSLAPEVEGGEELVKYLKETGVVASLGHTAAGYNDVEKAVKAGATNVTHTYNAQKAYHHRDIGTVGAALLLDELNCELICDTIHVSVPAIKMVVKNKPHDKVTLITDAMRAKQLEDGISELGGQTVIVKNGEARLENGALAGSVLLMNHAVKNVVEKCGVSFTDAIDMASINPARNLGVDKEMGSIALGKKANINEQKPPIIQLVQVLIIVLSIAIPLIIK